MKKINDITSIIDKYGSICIEIKRLEKLKEEIREKLLNLEVGTYEGNNFSLTVSESINYTYNVEKVYEKLGKTNFLKCVKIVNEKLKQYIAPTELNKIIESSEIIKRLLIKEKGE